MQPQSALAGISKHSDSLYGELIRKWLVIFAENASKEISSGLLSVWLESFRGIELPVLEAAFQATLNSWRITQIPPAGEIHAHIKRASSLVDQVEAEKAWQGLLRYVEKYVNPDMLNGLYRDAPPLPELVDYASRAAGGLCWLATCPPERIEWARRNFLEVYRSARELQASGHLLSDGEANRILGELIEKSQVKSALAAKKAL